MTTYVVLVVGTAFVITHFVKLSTATIYISIFRFWKEERKHEIDSIFSSGYCKRIEVKNPAGGSTNHFLDWQNMTVQYGRLVPTRDMPCNLNPAFWLAQINSIARYVNPRKNQGKKISVGNVAYAARAPLFTRYAATCIGKVSG